MPFPAAQVVQRLLIDRGLAMPPAGPSTAWPVSLGNLSPEKPDNQLMVMDGVSLTEGRITRTGERVEKPTVVVTVRAVDYVVGKAKGQQLESEFDGIIPDSTYGWPVVEVNDEYYEVQAAHVTVPTVKVSREEQNRRDLFTMNVKLTLVVKTYILEDAGGGLFTAADDGGVLVAVTGSYRGPRPAQPYLRFNAAGSSGYLAVLEDFID